MMGSKNFGVIAAGHPETASAGIKMLEMGGNAFDAAVAALLASCVAETGLTSLAGGGFLLAHTADHQNILFDFFSQTPRHKSVDPQLNFYPVTVNFGDAVQEFHIGLGSMAVPGNVAGIFHVHQKLGRLPFSEVVAPAITLAETGVILNSFQHYLFSTVLRPILLASPAGYPIYEPTGDIIPLGGKLTITDLGKTLRKLAEYGPREFYEGEIAQQLVKDCQEQGGHLTLEDLSSYQVIERDPLILNYRGNTLLTNPPPSSGGTLIAFALQLLSTLDLKKYPFGSVEHLQILARVMELSNQARKSNFDPELYTPQIAEKFLSEDHFSPYQEQLRQTVNKLGSTTHISVIDQEGNGASVTTSNGEGSGYIIPGTGIMVNNMLGEEDLNPHGFHQWQENVRISSMMSPTIVLKNNQPEIVIGSGGSNRIRTAILQVISNILDFKMSVEAAVSSPRIHWENQRLSLEPGFSSETIKTLQEIFPQAQQWSEKNMFFGGLHTVMEDAEGQITGAGDGRRNGVSLQTAKGIDYSNFHTDEVQV